MKFETADTLLWRVVDGWHGGDPGFVLLVGSGVSLPDGPGQPGVPGTEGAFDVALRCLQHDAKLCGEIEALRASTGQDRYQRLFELVGPRVNARLVSAIVHELVFCALPGAVPVTDRLGWDDDRLREHLVDREYRGAWGLPTAVQALGAVLAKHRRRFARDVLTTNFDPLLSVATRRAGAESHPFDLCVDASPAAFLGDGYRVLHLHGHWRGRWQRHSVGALTQPRDVLSHYVQGVLAKHPVMVLGYGGWDDVITNAIREAWKRQEGLQLLWCFRETDDEEIQRKYPKVVGLLDQIASAGAGSAAYKGVDARVWLPELERKLDEHVGARSVALAAPRTVSEPPMPAAKVSPYVVGRVLLPEEIGETRRVHRVQLGRLLSEHGSGELVGERRMGKTSLLRWAEAEARRLRPDVPMAFVSMQQVGKRPERLVEKVFELVRGSRLEVENSAAALRVLQDLCATKLFLFVDEADGLFTEVRKEDAEFYEGCRVLTQTRALCWLSASLHKFQATLAELRVSSRFLNDAYSVDCVGALSDGEAARVARRGLTEAQATRALELAGTNPHPLQVLCEQLWLRPQDAPGAERAFREFLAPTFASWLDARSDEQIVVLRRLTSSPETVPADIADGLVVRGLVREVASPNTAPPAVQINGAAWAAYLRTRLGGASHD